MKTNSHSYIDNPNNENIKIYINGEFHLRDNAKISVFDSGFLLGDGVCESFRLHNGHLCFIDEHINRLINGARELSIDINKTKNELIELIKSTVSINNMHSNCHIRMIISRGLKKTPYQHPNANVGPISIVIIPEYKLADQKVNERGLNLKSVNIIRGTKQNQNPNINSLSKFNCIAACIEGDKLGGDEALMLDINGNVSTCNSTNFFIVKEKEVWTSTGDYCLKGITRQNIIEICNDEGIPVFEKNYTLNDVYTADEAFITGTFAGVIPATTIDDKQLSNGIRGKITEKLYHLYKNKIELLYPEND